MKVQDLADALGAHLRGDGGVEVKSLASVQSANDESLVFVEDAKWLAEALQSKAAAVVAGEFAADALGKPLLIARQPKLAFARAARILQPSSASRAGIHPTAVVGPGATIPSSVSVGAYAVIGSNVGIGEHTRIGNNCVISDDVQIGDHCELKSHVTIYSGTSIGDRAILHSGVVLGSDGFGYVRDGDTGAYEKFPQIGRLKIGNDVEIGANSTVDRGALDETTISDGVKIDNLVHVGHNVRIGKNVVIAAQTGISGSVVIEDNVIVAGQVGLADHVRIEEGAILGAQCGVPSNKVIRGKGIVFWGTPARPIREYLKELAALSRLSKK